MNEGRRAVTVIRQRKRLSVSQLRDFLACRWRYRAVHLERRVTVADPLLTFGQLEHAAIQKYIQHLVATKQESAPQDVDQVWLGFARDFGRDGWALTEELANEARAMLARFARTFRLDLERLWMPEAELAIDLEGRPVDWDDPRAWLRGRLDLPYVAGSMAEIIDIKTGFAVPGDLRDDLQARTYPFLLACWNPRVREVQVHFDNIRLGVRRSAFFGLQDFEATRQAWLGWSDAVEAALDRPDDPGVWAPTPGPHCATCPCSTSCPLGTELLDEVTIATPEQAHEVAKRLVVLDAAREALRDRLKSWVLDRGRVEVGAGRWEFVKAKSYDYSVPQVLRLAQEHFVEPADVLKVDTDKLKRLAKRAGAFVQAIQALRVDKGRTTFRYYRSREEEGEQ